MKSRQTKWAIILCLCITFFLGTSGCAEEDGCYLIRLRILGEEASFVGREIKVMGVTGKISKFNDPLLGSLFKTNDFLFKTDDEETFFHKPLHIAVTEGDTVLSETTFRRSSCRDWREHSYSDRPLMSEENLLYLREDGEISPEIPGKARTIYAYHSCSDIPKPPCSDVEAPFL